MEASNHRSCGVSFILVDTAIIVKERLNHTQCLTIQPPMLKHSQGQVPGYIPQQTGYYVTSQVAIGPHRNMARTPLEKQLDQLLLEGGPYGPI